MKLEVGSIVQVNPKNDVFGGCLVVVSEVKSWGIQGYVQAPGEKGQAYIRVSIGNFENTGGTAPWIVE